MYHSPTRQPRKSIEDEFAAGDIADASSSEIPATLPPYATMDPRREAKKLNEEIDAGGWRRPRPEEEHEMKGEKEKNRDGNDLQQDTRFTITPPE